MTELTISLETGSGRPLYEQIYHHIKTEILDGGLPFQERLPSTRKLAQYLQVSRSTVDMAYEQLLSEGYIESAPCRGYFVSELDGIYKSVAKETEEARTAEVKKEHYRFDFSPNGVDLDSFPHNAWRKLSRVVLQDDEKELFMLGEPAGELELRSTIAAHPPVPGRQLPAGTGGGGSRNRLSPHAFAGSFRGEAFHRHGEPYL